jgi:hypothetical protein
MNKNYGESIIISCIRIIMLQKAIQDYFDKLYPK